MRLCPSVEGSAFPLITHRIGADVCLARQATNFHKCHRCVYRGQTADWEPEEPFEAVVNLHAGEEAAVAAGKSHSDRKVVIPRPGGRAVTAASSGTNG